VGSFDGPCDSVKSETVALGRELDLGANMEEGKVARNQVVLDASSNVENVDLATEDVLGLLKGVVGGPGRSGFDLVEAGCEV
jgi:hypothetical protein